LVINCGGFLNTDLIEILNYIGDGYKPLVTFGSWRVAVLNYMDELDPARITTMERHKSTDEVFIKTTGKAMMVLGGNDSEVGELSTYEMNVGEIYNIKRNTWHTIIVSRDVHLVIMENDDTNDENSEVCSLPPDIQQATRKLAYTFLTA
jgi:ureidoglycolate hydrolase